VILSRALFAYSDVAKFSANLELAGFVSVTRRESTLISTSNIRIRADDKDAVRLKVIQGNPRSLYSA